jgi:hypothetical protein
MAPTRLLYVKDVAHLRGVDESTARRWLVALEKRHGSAIVGRIGRKIFTTEAGLARVAPAIAPSRTERDAAHRLGNRLSQLWRRVSELASSVRGLGERVARLETLTGREPLPRPAVVA